MSHQNCLLNYILGFRLLLLVLSGAQNKVSAIYEKFFFSIYSVYVHKLSSHSPKESEQV